MSNNIEEYLASCEDLSEEQLIEFIKHVGNTRKTNQLNITKYQTRDYVICRASLDKNLETLAEMPKATEAFDAAQ
jgi:hypothetical protein